MLHKRQVICMLIMPLVIQAIENDDDRCFMEQVYTNYGRLMYSTAWKYAVSGVEVDDVVSDCCVSLIARVSLLRSMDDNALGAYVIATARNAAIDASRKVCRHNERIRHEVPEVLENISDGKSTEERVMLREKLRAIMTATAGLPWIEQDILRMKCQQGMTAREIAEQAGISEDEVWKYLKHARKIIRQTV